MGRQRICNVRKRDMHNVIRRRVRNISGQPLLNPFDFQKTQDYIDTFDESNGNRELSLIYLYRIHFYKNDNRETIMLPELERIDTQIIMLGSILTGYKNPPCIVFKSLIYIHTNPYFNEPDPTIFEIYDKLTVGKLKKLIMCHGKTYERKFDCALTLDRCSEVHPDIIANMYSSQQMKIIPNMYFDVIIFCNGPICRLHVDYKISDVKDFFSLIIKKISDNGLLKIIQNSLSPGLIETIKSRLVRNINFEFL